MTVRQRQLDLPLLLAACAAVSWAVARACLQSVTLDEADGYMNFVAADWPGHFYASSGNHVLNSILERIFTGVFGLSHLTLRAPALVGGALYVAASYALCVRIAAKPAIRWPLFLCLVYNPFVMDYMVVARGYGLALGLLMTSLWAITESRPAIASVAIGLSFCANFSFAWIDAAVILMFTAQGWRKKSWRVLARTLVPGAVAVFLICGSALWKFPKGQLYYGASHLRETWSRLVSSTFDELNPFVVHELLQAGLEVLAKVLPALVVAVLIWQMLTIVWTVQPFGLILARAIAIAVLGHWLMHRFYGVPLPMERTSIFFVPLAMLLIGLGAAVTPASRLGMCRQFAGIAVLSLCAFYFLGCLRLSHFKEWKFDADVKQVYGVLSDLHRRTGVQEFGIDWRYASPLNFYREYLHDHSLPEFHGKSVPPPGQQVYVVHSAWGGDAFVEAEHLRVIYHGGLSDVLVAVRPAQ